MGMLVGAVLAARRGRPWESVVPILATAGILFASSRAPSFDANLLQIVFTGLIQVVAPATL
ncbi:hypothetical protein ADILRU_0299 [Leifsonia rubra CMS 76R]|nr:hypothetical protein ADILRU_0299 [Leifsonia rubra CMS 76R]